MPVNFPSPDPDDKDLVPFVFFPNRGGGCGFAETDQGYETTSGYALPEGYDRTINFMCRDGKLLTPSFAFNYRKYPYYSAANLPTYPPSFLTSWHTTTFIPFSVFALYTAAWKFQDGAAASETDATTETYASATFHDDGAGTALLYAGMFSTTDGTAQEINRRTQDGTWTEDADVTGKYLISLAGALWRTTSDYQVSKCPQGSDPFTLASWGSAIQVGTSDSKITAIAGIGAAPYVLKEDAIYAFSEADSRFNPIYRAANKHVHNFNFAVPNGSGGFYTATANGDIIDVQQFGAIVVDNPIKDAGVGRDSPWGRIEHMAVDGDTVYLLMAPAFKLTKNVNLTVGKTTDNGATFSDVTANLVDDSLSTTVDFQIDTLANGDAFIIGADTPFLAFQLVRSAIATGTTNFTMNCAVSTGSTWASSWTSVDISDGTNLYDLTNSRSLSRTGIVSIRDSSTISGWTTGTYTVGGVSKTKYWIRVSFSAAVEASRPISDLSVVQKRGAPDFSLTNTNNATVWEASGMYCKVLKCRRESDRLIPDDIYTTHSVAGAARNQFRTPGSNKIGLSQASTTNSPDGSLLVACRDEFVQMALPYHNDPSIAPYPVLQRDATDQIAPVFYPSTIDTGGWYEPRYIDLYAKDFSEGTDQQQIAIRMDDTNDWFMTSKYTDAYVRIELDGSELQGRKINLAYHMNDGASTDPVAPSLEAGIVWCKPKKRAQVVRQPARAAAETT